MKKTTQKNVDFVVVSFLNEICNCANTRINGERASKNVHMMLTILTDFAVSYQ